LHGERAAEFLVLLPDLGFLGFERHVFLAEQLDVILHVANEHIVARRRQLGPLRMRDEQFLQLELARLEFRLDLFDKMQISLLRLGVVRVARHRDVTARRFLVERGAEFAPRQQPRFQIRDGWAAATRVSSWSNNGAICPITQVNWAGHKLARLVSGQRTKGNKFMAMIVGDAMKRLEQKI
jgi:hypothetical protein